MGSVNLTPANSWPFNGLHLRGNRQGLLLTTGRNSHFGVFIFLVVRGHSTTTWTKFATIIFCFQNCSDLFLEKNVLLIENIFWNSRLKVENLQNFWDHKNNLFEQWNVRAIFNFLTCFWRFLKSYTLEQLYFKLEKIIGIFKPTGKVR